LLYALGVVIFALGILISIALHEVGHLVGAKKFGVKVTQYMVGFGPTVWSRKRGDTEYGVKAVPFGGYIRMIGMVPPNDTSKPSRWPRRMASAVEDFRQTSRCEVGPGDEEREFYRLTPGKKMIVMLGGPAMNLVIYLVLSMALLTLMGQKNPTTTVESVSQCVVAANSADAAAGTCPASAPDAPAAQAGLRPGDKIVAIDGAAITSWDQAVAIIERSAGQRLTMTVQRDGAQRQLSITPVENTKYANDTGTATFVAGYIGVSPTERYQPLSVTAAPGQIGSQISSAFRALGSYPQKIGSLWGTVFDGKPRDPNGAIGVVGLGRLGGDVADSHVLDLQDKIYFLFGLLASVNLLLCLFNLLPLLPLDGGHVLGALIESVRRGAARLRARRATAGPDGTRAARPPIFVDTAQFLPVMYAVTSVLVLVTMLVIYADIVKPITIGG